MKHTAPTKVFVYCPDSTVISLDTTTTEMVHEIDDTTHWKNWPGWSTLSGAQKICAILTYCPANDLRYSDWIRWKSLTWFDLQEELFFHQEHVKRVRRAFTESSAKFPGEWLT